METLSIGEADAAREVQASVGQLIEVVLTGDRPNSAWELDSLSGDALERVPGKEAFELIVQPGQDDPSVGTYYFRFRAAKAGVGSLRFDYIYPAGQGLYPAGQGERRRTEWIREAEFAVRVRST